MADIIQEKVPVSRLLRKEDREKEKEGIYRDWMSQSGRALTYSDVRLPQVGGSMWADFVLSSAGSAKGEKGENCLYEPNQEKGGEKKATQEKVQIKKGRFRASNKLKKIYYPWKCV